MPKSLEEIDAEDPEEIQTWLDSENEALRRKGSLALFNKAAYGFCGWRAWRKCHWGTEYPADLSGGELFVDDDKEHFSIDFDTDDYPVGIAHALFVLFPEIEFSWNCTDEDEDEKYLNLTDLQREGFGFLANNPDFPNAGYLELLKKMF
jgi:hypothetical protein